MYSTNLRCCKFTENLHNEELSIETKMVTLGQTYKTPFGDLKCSNYLQYLRIQRGRY